MGSFVRWEGRNRVGGTKEGPEGSRNRKRDRIAKQLFLHPQILSYHQPTWVASSVRQGHPAPQRKVMTLQVKQMAKFASRAPSWLWGQTGRCCLYKPPFLQMPRAGNQSQRQASGEIRCDVKQDAHGTPPCWVGPQCRPLKSPRLLVHTVTCVFV